MLGGAREKGLVRDVGPAQQAEGRNHGDAPAAEGEPAHQGLGPFGAVQCAAKAPVAGQNLGEELPREGLPGFLGAQVGGPVLAGEIQAAEQRAFLVGVVLEQAVRKGAQAGPQTLDSTGEANQIGLGLAVVDDNQQQLLDPFRQASKRILDELLGRSAAGVGLSHGLLQRVLGQGIAQGLETGHPVALGHDDVDRQLQLEQAHELVDAAPVQAPQIEQLIPVAFGEGFQRHGDDDAVERFLFPIACQQLQQFGPLRIASALFVTQIAAGGVHENGLVVQAPFHAALAAPQGVVVDGGRRQLGLGQQGCLAGILGPQHQVPGQHIDRIAVVLEPGGTEQAEHALEAALQLADTLPGPAPSHGFAGLGRLAAFHIHQPLNPTLGAITHHHPAYGQEHQPADKEDAQENQGIGDRVVQHPGRRHQRRRQ